MVLAFLDNDSLNIGYQFDGLGMNQSEVVNGIYKNMGREKSRRISFVATFSYGSD